MTVACVASALVAFLTNRLDLDDDIDEDTDDDEDNDEDNDAGSDDEDDDESDFDEDEEEPETWQVSHAPDASGVLRK